MTVSPADMVDRLVDTVPALAHLRDEHLEDVGLLRPHVLMGEVALVSGPGI